MGIIFGREEPRLPGGGGTNHINIESNDYEDGQAGCKSVDDENKKSQLMVVWLLGMSSLLKERT